MGENAIRVEGLAKAYRLGVREARHDTLAGQLASWARAPLRNFRRIRGLDTLRAGVGPDEDDLFWALRDVSFDVGHGEVLGIVGRNGAGKSTLLKVLSRITDPTLGWIGVNGRVASLLEVGTGFHPELSGRENVYMNGTILGMSRREIGRKFDEIVAFSGVERFLETPIKRYSSGMKVRLAFAVAAHLEPEILVIDEVLSVGDAEFQRRCLGKMHEVAGDGRTVLFVSHNMGSVVDLCTRCLFLRQGRVVDEGAPAEVVGRYLASDRESQAQGFVDLAEWERERTGAGPMRVRFVQSEDDEGRVKGTFRYGDPLRIRFGVLGRRGMVCLPSVSIRNSRNQLVLHIASSDDGAEVVLPADEAEVVMRIGDLILNDDTYYVTVWLGDGTNLLHDRVGNCLEFEVSSVAQGSIRSAAPVRVGAGWECLPAGAEERRNLEQYSPLPLAGEGGEPWRAG